MNKSEIEDYLLDNGWKRDFKYLPFDYIDVDGETKQSPYFSTMFSNFEDGWMKGRSRDLETAYKIAMMVKEAIKTSETTEAEASKNEYFKITAFWNDKKQIVEYTLSSSPRCYITRDNQGWPEVHISYNNHDVFESRADAYEGIDSINYARNFKSEFFDKEGDEYEHS